MHRISRRPPPYAHATTLARLWETLLAYGVDQPHGKAEPRQTAQWIPHIEDERERYRAWLTESVYTGLYTSEPDVMLRAYVQAASYAERMAGMRDEPGAYMRDCVAELRMRVEGFFLYGEG